MGGGSSSKQPDPLYVDMGLPSGRLWAKSNLDVTQPNGFAASPFQYVCSFFSWGNVDAHNPIDNSHFSYDWGNWENSKNEDSTGYKPSSIYGQTVGCSILQNLTNAQDAAYVNIGLPWRIPTIAEVNELLQNCVYVMADGITQVTAANKIVSVNGVKGIYLKSLQNGNLLFLACCGNGSSTGWTNVTTGGNYWCRNFVSARAARCLHFVADGIYPSYTYERCYGFTIRPVI